MKGGNDMGYHNMSGGVMKDIPERADFSDSDEDMTDVNHMQRHQIGKADSFQLIDNFNN